MPSTPSAEPRAAKDVAPFLKQLRVMLEEEHPTVLRWTADGRAFEIADMGQMMNHVLPKYFKHRKYTSFQRQLNYFNFRKWTKSKATVCTFSNEFFRRDMPELAWRITRKKSVHTAASQHQKQRMVSRLQPHKSLPPSPTMQSTSAPSTTPFPQTTKLPKAIAITVPERPCKEVPSCGSFPSPTDFEMLLKTHDFPPHAFEPTSLSAPAADALEPFEWIDVLFPFVDRIEDPAYPSYLYPPMPGAYGCVLASQPHRLDHLSF